MVNSLAGKKVPYDRLIDVASLISDYYEYKPDLSLENERDKFGKSYYERIDSPATLEEKKILKNLNPKSINISTLAGEKIEKILTKAPGNSAPIGGLKIVTKNGWVAMRPSGTEDIYKIYAESFLSKEHLKQIQKEAQEIMRELFKMHKGDLSF